MLPAHGFAGFCRRGGGLTPSLNPGLREGVSAHLNPQCGAGRTMQEVWDRLVLQDEAPPAGEAPQAAVLAPLYVDSSGTQRLVLTKRPYTMPTHAGHLAFPGGRPDPGDDGPQRPARSHRVAGVACGRVA